MTDVITSRRDLLVAPMLAAVDAASRRREKCVNEPAIIAITGIGPIHYSLTDPSKPGWRQA